MDKKLTTTLGIALGTSLLAAASYGIYKFIRSKRATTKPTVGSGKTGFISGFIGDSLVKSKSLYGNNALTRSRGIYGGIVTESESLLS